MDANFWQQKWQSKDIAFHERVANPFLVTYFKELALPPGSRVFVPLCGKTLDIAWLLSQGYRVAGAELSKLAIEQLYQELGVAPAITKAGELTRYSASNIDILVGDIFALSGAQLGTVDAVYDRAALVALPPEMRKRYTAHLMAITVTAPQLLVTFEYDQSLMEGPPFSLSSDEIKRHYGKSYAVTLVNSRDVAGGLKGKCVAHETIWLLKLR